jgi:hypothetical protein
MHGIDLREKDRQEAVPLSLFESGSGFSLTAPAEQS